MDKRIIKTKQAIFDALLELIRKRGIEHIQVKELCDKAVINKTTFYRYYMDIPDLIEQCRDEVADKIVVDFIHKDQLFQNPELFFKGMYETIANNEKTIMLLFPENAINGLIHRLDERLCKCYVSEQSEFENEVEMSFLIGGSSYACMKYLDRMDNVSEVVAKLINRLK